MTIRTFWTILLKILGISLVFSSMTVIPQFLSALFSFDADAVHSFVLTAALLVLTICIYFFILRVFVFKTSWLIDKLHLDKGFEDDKIDFNIHHTTVLTVSVIVIGGLMFVDSLPELIKELFFIYRRDVLFTEYENSGWIIFHLIKTIIGYLLMTNSKIVVSFIKNKSADQNEKID